MLQKFCITVEQIWFEWHRYLWKAEMSRYYERKFWELRQAFIARKLTTSLFSNIQNTGISLFREKISACAAVHMCYVMDACDCVWPIILLPPMMGTSFAKHRVIWSHRTCVNYPFSRGGKNPILSCFCLTTSFLTHFYLWCK